MGMKAAASTPLLSFSSKSHLSCRFPQFDRGRSFPTTTGCCCCCGARPSLSSYATYASLLRPKPNATASQNTRRPMLPPYNVLITGSTKGIGFALAKEFLRAGDNVVICSRSAERVESTVQSLREEFGEQHVWGTKCDVREGKDVKDLVVFVQKNLKYIDIWDQTHIVINPWQRPQMKILCNKDDVGSASRWSCFQLMELVLMEDQPQGLLHMEQQSVVWCI